MNSPKNGTAPQLQFSFLPNPRTDLRTQFPSEPLGGQWVARDTAILVIHGIGHQQPFDTLDQFARGLVGTYRSRGRPDIRLEHRIVPKPARDPQSVWFDNCIRLTVPDSTHPIDLYEYYWANQTEDRATLADIQRWLRDVADRATRFYCENFHLGQRCSDRSLFFKVVTDKPTGGTRVVFRPRRYKIFLMGAGFAIPFMVKLGEGAAALVRSIPLLGQVLGPSISRIEKSGAHSLANVIGDIIIYNTGDATSKHYEIRRKILDGAVKAVRFLVEPRDPLVGPARPWAYERVIVAGHSLGSQVGFDAMNRLNLYVTQGALSGFDQQGRFLVKGQPTPVAGLGNIAELLCGFITFGSPLDKMAFFLRAQSDKTQFLRQQIVEHYHAFKQRDWSAQENTPEFIPLRGMFRRQFSEIRWRNYHDRNDFVSGALDYYEQVVNVDCRFPEEVPAGVFLALRVAWTLWLLATVALIVWLIASLWTLLAVHPLSEISAVLRPRTALELLSRGWPLWVWCLGTLAITSGSGFAIGRLFTHSAYWQAQPMYLDIITEFLHPAKPLKHP